MRKIVISVLALICFLSGCGAKNTSSLVLNSISFSADIIYNDGHYVADCVIDGQKELSVSLTFPENLAGVNVICGNGGCKILYNGIVIDGKDGRFPKTSVISVIKQISDTVDGREFDAANGNGEVTGKLDGYDYSVTASPGGLPISLQIPGISLKVQFKNVSLV